MAFAAFCLWLGASKEVPDGRNRPRKSGTGLDDHSVARAAMDGGIGLGGVAKTENRMGRDRERPQLSAGKSIAYPAQRFTARDRRQRPRVDTDVSVLAARELEDVELHD